MIFNTAFERFSYANQERVKIAVEKTAESVTPGGAVFGVLEEVLRSLKRIESASGSNSSSVLSMLLGKKTLIGIGESFKLIAEAINSISGTGAEAKEKIGAIVDGVNAVIGLGKGLISFSATLALATPLLIIAMPFSFLFAGSLRIILGALQYAAKVLSNPETLRALENLDKVGKSILILGGALVLAAPLYAIGIISSVAIAFVLSTLGLTFWALDKLGVSRSMEETANSLIRASIAIVTIGLSFATTYLILSAIGGGNFYVATLQMLGIVVLVGAAFALIGLVAPLIKKASIALILASVAITTIALGIFVFRQLIPADKEGWTTLAQVGAALVGIGAIMALAGTFALPIALGAIVLGLAGLSLLIVAAGIGAISSVFKGDGLGNMLAPSGQKTKGFLGIGGGRDMSKLEYLLLSIANSFVINPFKIAAIYVTAPAMILASIALFAIAKSLKKVQEMNIDADVMVPKIESIVTVLATAFGNVGKKFPGGRKSLFNRAFGGGQQSAVADGISAVTGMGDAIHDIAKGIKMMAELKFPIYKGTKIVGYTDLRNPGIFNKVTENISYLVRSLSSVFGEIGASPDAKKSWWFGRSNMKRGIKLVGKLGKPIERLSRVVMDFNEMDVDTNQVAQKLKDMIHAISAPFTEMISDDNDTISKLIINRIEDLGDSLQKMGRNIYTWNRFVDSFGRYARHFGTFKKEVNGLDRENLKMVNDLFTSLSGFDANSIEQLGIKLTAAINLMKKEIAKSIDTGSNKVAETNIENTSEIRRAIEAGSNIPGPAGFGFEAIDKLLIATDKLSKFVGNKVFSNNNEFQDALVQSGLSDLDDVLAQLTTAIEKLNQKL